MKDELFSDDSASDDKQTLLPQDVFDALSAQYTEFVAIETPVGVAAFRCATKGEYDKFLAMMNNDAQKPRAPEILAKTCVVHPSREAFAAMVEKKPAIIGACSSAALEASGMDITKQSKKFGSGSGKT